MYFKIGFGVQVKPMEYLKFGQSYYIKLALTSWIVIQPFQGYSTSNTT